MFKQAIIIRTDLDMGKGKIAAQASHACLQSFKAASARDVEEWEFDGSKKVVLKVGSEKDLVELFMQAKKKRLPCALIKDAGHTQITPGTVTALAIGPCEEKDVDALTGTLKLL